QCDFPCDDPEDCDLMYIPPLSASIQCRMHTVDIARLFKVNPILRFLPHLQMTAVWSVEMVGKFMDNFPMLESLQLCHCRTNSVSKKMLSEQSFMIIFVIFREFSIPNGLPP